MTRAAPLPPSLVPVPEHAVELELAEALLECVDLAGVALRIESDLARLVAGVRVDFWLFDPVGPMRSVRGRDADAELARQLKQFKPQDEHPRQLSWLLSEQPGFLRCMVRIECQPPRAELPEAVAQRWRTWLKPLRKALPAALRTERLTQRLRRLEYNERLQRALFAITDLASTASEMEELARGLHHIVAQLMYAQNFYIVRYDAHRDRLRFLYYADEQDPQPPSSADQFDAREIADSLTVGLIRHGRPLHGSSTELLAKLGIPNSSFAGPDAHDWLGVPMVSGGEVRGAVVVQSYDPSRHFTHADRELLIYVAQHILTALERKEAHEELEQRVEQRTEELRREVEERKRAERLQRVLFRIAELSVVADSPLQFYAAVHREVSELLNARNFFIALLDEDGTGLTFPYSADEKDVARLPRKLAKGLTEYVLRKGVPVLADRAEIDRLNRLGEVLSFGTPSVCWLGVPLIEHDRTVGVLAVQSYSEAWRYTLADQELLTFVAHHIGTGLERKRAADALKHANQELEHRVAERTRELAATNRELRAQILVRERVEHQLKHEALHDVLTGLPNRAFLLERLDDALGRAALEPDSRFAVLFLDLDRFKVVNDSVGHLVGDEMLKLAGRRIQSCLGSADLVARLGGDEFAVLVSDGDDLKQIEDLARQLIDRLSEPMRIGGKELFTSASIGIALSDPRYHRAEELLRDADVAMYRAKSRGRKRFELFDQQLHHEALRLLDLESDLKRALTRNEFEPYFQAIVRLSDQSIVGYEALLRWRHGERGILVPSEFLAVAEDSGAVEEIDWQLFGHALRQFGALGQGTQYVAVNVSGRHFRAPDFAGEFLRLLGRSRLAAHRVRIEVTEGVLLENPDHVRRTLEQLREAGVLAQLDDFGTGYSSLSYLHRFPLHALKIDRSFVSDLGQPGEGGSHAVVKAILALARSLGLEVIAEGIQRENERLALLGLDCQLGQGFLFARPAGIADLAG